MDHNEVAGILLKYREGSTTLYNIFVSHLSDAGLKDEVLLHSLKGLKDCTTLLGKEFEHLVGIILKVDWLTRDVTVIKEYQGFIINLVSAHTDYLRACLVMLVKKFIPGISSSTIHEEDIIIDDVTKQKHEEAFVEIHWLLKHLLKLVPMAPTVLLPLLSEFFPYMSKEPYLQACYVRNLLQLIQHIPSHRRLVFELIVDRMTKLDVRSPRQAIEESYETDNDMEIIFDMDAIDERAKSPDPKGSNMEEGQPMTHKDADRLDMMMDIVLNYIHKSCYNKKETLDWEATKQLYRDLLLIFDRIILPTHACYHVQFIMFYICHFKEALVVGFLDYLWKKSCDPNTQSIFRQAAVAYIASILARAKYIPVSTVKSCLDMLIPWTHSYIQQTADTGTKADVAHHGPFYSVCQSIFYIFAFRHKELLALPNGYQYCQGLQLQTIVTCRLNPLKVCLPIVVRTFSTIARKHQLVYCDSIMEHNRRMTLPEADSGDATHTRLTNLNPLDSFFPFDPYMLSRSGKYIHPLYQEYDGAEEELTDDECGSNDMPLNTRVDDAEFASYSYKAQHMATSPTDLLMYSISPGFKHL